MNELKVLLNEIEKRALRYTMKGGCVFVLVPCMVNSKNSINKVQVNNFKHLKGILRG